MLTPSLLKFLLVNEFRSLRDLLQDDYGILEVNQLGDCLFETLLIFTHGNMDPMWEHFFN